MKQQRIHTESLLTSHQVGKLLQVDPSSVSKWVKDGRIVAFRTPGGHHRIRAADLVAFLRRHEMLVPRELTEAGRRRLLVMEAEPKQLATLARQLAAREEEVETRLLGRGIDALVELGAFAPHVALLDVGMPEIDAFEVSQRLPALPATARTRVILCAAKVTPKIEKRAAEVGATRCLGKPVAMEALLEELGLPPG